MARNHRKTAAKSQGSKKQAPSKTPRGRRNAATNDNFPRIGAPYFAHETLDPAIYPAYVRQPVGGPSPNTTVLEPEGDESDDVVLDDGSQADDESDSQVKSQKANMSIRSPASPLRDVKRIRVEGGRAPAPRRILADLDSDDEVIVKMKAEKFTDKQIAARLREEGRVDYHYKTISSRWVRIKRALEKKHDQDLDDQLTDWHEGDVGQKALRARKYADLLKDYVLLQAITAADREVYRLKQAAQDKKWKLVSMQMKGIKPSTSYSTGACRSRFEALENDIATIPPELDDDPQQRAIQREAAKKTAEKNIAKRRVERAEESGTVRAVNDASKRISAIVEETHSSNSSIDSTRPVRNSLPVNYAVDISDEDSSLSDLDSSIFGGSSASSGDQVLFPGKPTSRFSTEVSTRVDQESLALQSKEVVSAHKLESLFASVANINTLDRECGTSHNEAALISSNHQTSQRERHSTQQKCTNITGSEGEAVVQDAEHLLKVTAHEESAESSKSLGGTTKSPVTFELHTESKSLQDNPRAATNHTNQCRYTTPSPRSPSTCCSSGSVTDQQTPLPLVEEDLSPSTAAQLLLELRNRDFVEKAANDQTTKRVKAEENTETDNRPPLELDMEEILRSKDLELLQAASRRFHLPNNRNKAANVRQLLNYHNRYGANDSIFKPNPEEHATNPDTTGGSEKRRSVNDPIDVQDSPESEINPKATDKSQHSGARKKARSGTAVVDFASVPGAQIERGQRREESPLPPTGWGFEPSDEYVEALAARNKKNELSREKEMKQRRESGPPTGNPRYSRRGSGGIDASQRLSSTSTHPNVATARLQPTASVGFSLPKPTPGDGRTRHELDPPLPSEINIANNFPTSEYNLRQARDNLRLRGNQVELVSARRAADSREARAQAPSVIDSTIAPATQDYIQQLREYVEGLDNEVTPIANAVAPSRIPKGGWRPVHTDYARGGIPSQPANVPPQDFTLPSTTASWQQSGANDPTIPYTPTPQQYGVGDLVMGQSGANDSASNFTPTHQGYGANIPIMDQSGANDPTIPYIPTPQQYGVGDLIMGQSDANDFTLNFTPTPQQYGANIPIMGQFGANYSMTSPHSFYGTNNPIMGGPYANNPLLMDTPSVYATNNPNMEAPQVNYHSMLTSPFSGTDNLSVGQLATNEPTVVTTSQFYAMNSPLGNPLMAAASMVINSETPASLESNSSVMDESVGHDTTMTEPSLLDAWAPGNVQDPAPQPQRRVQTQSNIEQRQPGPMHPPPRPIQVPGSGSMEVTRTIPSTASGSRDRSRAPRRRPDNTTTQAQTTTFDPNAQPIQPPAVAPAFGIARGALSRREQTWYRVRVSGVPRNTRKEELEELFAPYVCGTMDLFQVRNHRVVTLYFDDQFNAEAVVLRLDGAKMRSSYDLVAAMVDRAGNPAPVT